MPWWRALLGRRAVGTLAALTAAVLMAGCTSNPEPAPLPSPSASGSESAGASPSASASAAPSMPVEARGTSKKSAKAFVRYYVDVLNHATVTGRTSRAKQLSAPSCESCEAMLERIDEIYANGGYLAGEGWRVTDMKYQPLQPRRHPIISVGIRLAPQRLVERQGGSVERFEGGQNRLDLTLSRDERSWTVAQLERLS
jgi:hypothetical protein